MLLEHEITVETGFKNPVDNTGFSLSKNDSYTLIQSIPKRLSG